MSLQINKETKLFGSFSETPGNNGCLFFNNAFQKYGINAIYKSFYSNNIGDTIQSVKHLGFSGFALSFPHKIKILQYLNEIDEVADKIGAVNTVVNVDGKLVGYNTDFSGVEKFLTSFLTESNVNIVGNGGFSRAIQYTMKKMNIEYKIYERADVNKIDKQHNKIFINATPIDIESTRTISLGEGRKTMIIWIKQTNTAGGCILRIGNGNNGELFEILTGTNTIVGHFWGAGLAFGVNCKNLQNVYTQVVMKYTPRTGSSAGKTDRVLYPFILSCTLPSHSISDVLLYNLV